MKIYDFFTDGKKSGEFVYNAHPIFSWKIESKRKNVVQRAFELVIYYDDCEVWRTKSTTRQSIDIVCGVELSPFTPYKAQVSVTDNFGRTASAETSFETSKINEKFFGKFITCDIVSAPIYAVKKQIVCNKEIASARLYATARGLYEFYINDKRAGDSYFAPFWTDTDILWNIKVTT